MSDVLDASALLCVINREPGFEQVVPILAGASISAVNWCEVIAKLVERGAGQNILDDLGRLRVTVEPFDERQAHRAAMLRADTRAFGLSLCDRACLALALSRSGTAFTTDRIWGQLPASCGQVRVVR